MPCFDIFRAEGETERKRRKMSELTEVEYAFMYVEGVAGRTWEEAAEDRDDVIEYFMHEKETDKRVLEVECSKEETELDLSGETRKAAVAKIRMKSWVGWYSNELAKASSAFLEVVKPPWRDVYGPDGSLWFGTGPDRETESDPRAMGRIIEDLWAEKLLRETVERGDGPLGGKRPE